MPSISPGGNGTFNITYIQADGYHEQETFVGQGNLFSANLSLGGGGTSVTNVQQLNSSPIMVGFGGVHPWANFMKPFRRGDLVVNMLPTMDGGEARRLGPQAARDECLRRVRAHWRHMQTTLAEFQRYRIVWIAPALGVRDGYRLVGRYVLTEHDLLAGCGGQRHPDVIAIADHAMDTHGVPGGRGGCHELAQPYGIPYRCLLPKELDNLLVACRGASFSSLAASSCRLSRTMLQLGQAAGTAAALAKRLNIAPPDVPPPALGEALDTQHVQRTWPTPPDILARLREQ